MDLHPLQQDRQMRMMKADLGARTAGKPPFATHDARRPPLGY
jgi:hypothetical protein